MYLHRIRFKLRYVNFLKYIDFSNIFTNFLSGVPFILSYSLPLLRRTLVQNLTEKGIHISRKLILPYKTKVK
jgi:hypothetical protein